MTESDKQAFFELWAGAAENYRTELTKAAVRVAFVALEPLTIGEVQGGLMAHLRDPEQGQFFPKPADIIRHVRGTPKQREAELRDQAALNWLCVLTDLRGGTPTLQCEISRGVVKSLGGRKALSMLHVDALERKRREFVDLYVAFHTPAAARILAKLPEAAGALEAIRSESATQAIQQKLTALALDGEGKEA